MNHYNVFVKTEPAAEPLTRAEAKAHLRQDLTDEDALIDAFIATARIWTENYCRRSLVQRTLQLRMDFFAGTLLLPRGPIVSLTSIEYLDQNGNLTAVDPSVYQTDLYSEPARILPVFGAVWPIAKYGTVNSVLVEYEAGYAPSSDSPTDYGANVPQAIKSAMKLMIGHWYQNRNAVVLDNVQALEVPLGAKALLAPFEIRDFRLE